MENKNKKYVWSLVVICCAMTFSEISSACFIPRICQSEPNSHAYDLGSLKGANIVNSAWNAIDQDCAEVEGKDGFKKTVLNILHKLALPQGASEFVVCHYYGYIQGAKERLKEIADICRDNCVMDGEMIGHMATMLYCELSIAFGGLTPDNDFVEGIFNLCNESMVELCQNTFETWTPIHINIYGISCAPYTQGDHFPVWNLVKNNQCLYHP